MYIIEHKWHHSMIEKAQEPTFACLVLPFLHHFACQMSLRLFVHTPMLAQTNLMKL